ncbi:hypothetical protein KP22_04165 [Pectobacterium betavasculorum]|uniref:Uncharacterized protein n=2 Tax=Pectobacterium betavasculorum TaxID=55207 RepID=A0A093S394_9GAMM|nr:hypothetical protein KP22_04165 [Pectobacterium betavasculorum]
MPVGLQVFDKGGNLIHDTNHGFATLLGSFEISTTTGSKSLDIPYGKIFAFIAKGEREAVSNGRKYHFGVWVNGKTIYWDHIVKPVVVCYGLCT